MPRRRRTMILSVVALVFLVGFCAFLYSKKEQPSPETVAAITFDMKLNELIGLLGRLPDKGNPEALERDWLVWNSTHGRLSIGFGNDHQIWALTWDPHPPDQSIITRFLRWLGLHRDSPRRQEFRE